MKLKLYEFLYFFDDGEQLVCVVNGSKRFHKPMTVKELGKTEVWNEIADAYVDYSFSQNDVIYVSIK